MSEPRPGLIPIREKFLQNNYLLAVQFEEGYIFARTIRRRICQYRPYPLIDTTGASIDISPAGHQPEIVLRDPRNVTRKILFLETFTMAGLPWILHGSIGIKPEQILMYARFPPAGDIPGRFPNLDPIRPSEGNRLGYVSAFESPYEEPTDFVEYMIPPTMDIGFEFYNTDTERSHSPVLNILFAVYWIQVLRPDRHPRLISKIALREVPAAFFTIGFGDKPLSAPYNLYTQWETTPISLDQAAALGGGQR